MPSLAEQDRGHFLHPFTNIPDQQTHGSHVMVFGEGIRIRDIDGNEYIDAMAGLWCVNIGYGRPELVDAMAAQAGKLPYYHSFMSVANEPAIRLADRVASRTPDSVTRVFFGNSGSDANDTNVKIVWNYNNLRGKPEKKKFIARHGSYHGVTVASASLSGLPNLHKAFDVPLDGFLHVTRPHPYWDKPDPDMTDPEFSAWLGNELDETIQREGPETVAAFIAEPVMGAGGVIVPPDGYFDAIVPVLKKHDVLFIADEVVCGFGRLGAWFGSDYYGIQPDIMTLAKGLTSGYIPMSASVISEAIWQTLNDGTSEVGQFNHGYTYSAHPVAAATALANIDVIERNGLVDHAADAGAFFQESLRAAVADHPLVGDVRGIGLIAGVELVKDKTRKEPFDLSLGLSKRLYKILLAEGLICRPILNSLCFSPPLIITQDEIAEVIDTFARGLRTLADELFREGIWSD